MASIPHGICSDMPSSLMDGPTQASRSVHRQGDKLNPTTLTQHIARPPSALMEIPLREKKAGSDLRRVQQL